MYINSNSKLSAKKIFSLFLSFVLCSCIVLTMVPSVFASPTLDGAKDAEKYTEANKFVAVKPALTPELTNGQKADIYYTWDNSYVYLYAEYSQNTALIANKQQMTLWINSSPSKDATKKNASGNLTTIMGGPNGTCMSNSTTDFNITVSTSGTSSMYATNEKKTTAAGTYVSSKSADNKSLMLEVRVPRESGETQFAFGFETTDWSGTFVRYLSTTTINSGDPVVLTTLYKFNIDSLGANVTFTSKDATGSNYDVALLNGRPGYSYKAYVKDAVYGWTLVQPYSASTSFSITVANPTTPLQIEILQSAGGSPTGTPTFNRTLAQLGQVGITTFSLSASSYEVNSAITLGTVTTEIPATGTYRYELTLGDSGSSFSGLANAIAIENAIAKKPGTYKASLVIYKEGSKNTIFASKNFNYTIVDTNSVSTLPKYRTNDKLKAQALGNAVTLTKPVDSAAVGAASYKYRYLSPVADGISGSSYSNVLNIPSPGVYEVYADLLSGTVKSDSAYSLVRVYRGSDEVAVTGFEGAIADTATVGDTLTFNVDAANATQYMFVRRDASGYRTVKAWSSSDTWTWTPAKNGKYEIYAYAKAAGAGSYEASTGKAINVGNVSGSAPVAVAASSDAKKANSLTITGTANNLYAFEIIDTVSNKYVFSGYLAPDSGNENKVVFPFVAEVAGRDYKITTYVRNENNSGAYDGKTTTTLSFN